MTRPFAALSFPATGTSTPRSLGERFAEIKNVKDFGAKGDGVTDDWAAITAAYNWTADDSRGTILFPPGTYLVSQPIAIDGESAHFCLLGVYGASTITGNFADYILKRGNAIQAGSPGNSVENLAVINTHASGGGIRMGNCVVGAIRNCTVVANQGISNASDDTPAPLTDLDFNIINCSVSPGSNVSGSNGIMSIANGVILNCRIVGYETGMRFWANEGNMTVLGCYFEQNITAIAFGDPSGIGSTSGIIVCGCWFKNNGTALIGGNAGAGRFCGLRIEASEAITVGGGRPQYGIHVPDGALGLSLLSGITVTGQYDVAGVAVDSHAGHPVPTNTTFMGVRSFNTSSHGGVPWLVPTTPYTAQLIECNCPAPVYTMANLPTVSAPITSVSWSGGTATATIGADISDLTGEPQPINMQGVTPSGYNGIFTATVSGLNTVTYTVANPGSPTGSGGTIIVNPTHDGITNAFEGDCYNVSDASSATWGGNPVGGGSTHAKVRWGAGGTNWTVVGA